MSTQPPPTDQAHDPGTTPPGPGDRRGFRAFSEVRRSRDDRMLAGVCAGLARRFDIDPVVVRVLTFVLCFVGGAGLILYAAGWLLLPSDGEPRSHVGEWFGLDANESQVRDTGLVLAAALALFSIIGDGGWGWGPGWPFWVALFVGGPIALVLWLARRGPRREQRSAAAAGPVPGGTHPDAAASTWSQGRTDTVVLPGATPDEQQFAGLPPSGVPTPRRPLQPEPPRAPREPYSWIPTLLTLSSVAIALAVVRLVADPAWPAYVAVALAVVGLALVLCTFTRGGAPIILLGLALLPPLLLASFVPNLRGGEQFAAPTSAGQVEAEYSHGFGRLELDLSDVSDPDALLGRTIDVDTGMGQTVVTVPDGLPVIVDATVRAGDLDVLGRRASGISRTIRTPGTGPALTIDLQHSFGEVRVLSR